MLLALLQAFGRPPTDEAAVIAELTRRFSRALKQQIVVESVRVTLLDRTALGAEVVRAELPLMQAEVQRAVAEGVRGLSTSEATCATRPDAGACAPSGQLRTFEYNGFRAAEARADFARYGTPCVTLP